MNVRIEFEVLRPSGSTAFVPIGAILTTSFVGLVLI
jgi:hypothetical protein